MEYNINNAEIVKIYRSDKNKQGVPYRTKGGKPYAKVDIYFDNSVVDEVDFTGRVSMLDFENKAVGWQAGTIVSGVIRKNGNFWNFELPEKARGDYSSSEPQVTIEAFNDLVARVDELERTAGSDGSEKADTIDPDGELPF